MDYTEANIPVEIKHGEILTLESGGSVRWESNGEAKNVFLGNGFVPDTEIFPENSWEFCEASTCYRLTARFDDALLVERI